MTDRVDPVSAPTHVGASEGASEEARKWLEDQVAEADGLIARMAPAMRESYRAKSRPHALLALLDERTRERDRLAQALRLLRDTSSEGSYAHNLALNALADAGIPDPPEEDHL